MRSFLTAIGAVLSGFLGVRKHRQAARDAAKIRPVHVIMAGVLMVACFVGLLLSVVRAVVSS